MWCWGYDGNGQLGLGSTTDEDRPQQVMTPAADGWTGVSTGGYHTCATRDDSTLWCWGSRLYDQLGTGGTTSQDQPQQVTAPAGTGWTSVTAGLEDTCATRGHTLWCWGANGNGELGIGSFAEQDRPRPVFRPARTGWNLIALGQNATCAIRTGHSLWCWGAYASDVPQQVTS